MLRQHVYGHFQLLFSWFGSEATRIRRFLLSPWLVWWWRKTYINIVNCLFCSLVVKQHMYNILNCLFCWYSGQCVNMSTNIFNCLFSLLWWSTTAYINIWNCLFGLSCCQWTRLHTFLTVDFAAIVVKQHFYTILTVYFSCLHVEPALLYVHFQLHICLVWRSSNTYTYTFLSPWQIWLWQKTYINILNCLLCSSGGETTHLQHFKLFLIWWSINTCTNV